jgi:ADP-ribose pyrophosphatase
MDIIRPKSKQPIPEHAKKVFKGILFDVYQWEQELYDGKKVIFEKLKRPDTVLVLPILPDGQILLLKEEQPGKEKTVVSVGGRIEEGEDPISASKRELFEESGCEASEFILWDAQQPITKIDWTVYVFIAKGVKKISNLNTDGGEKIEPFSVSFDELFELVLNKTYSSDRGIIHKFFEAKLDQQKMEELKELFKP